MKTELLERGNTGVPQGSLEGMWNFGVYSDNIQDSITKATSGIAVGSEVVRAIVYADDISPVTQCSAETNAVLNSISEAGSFNSYKFKPSKCKVLGADKDDKTEYTLCKKSIERANYGLLLGAVVDGEGISAIEHVTRRAKMVVTAIRLIKSWRTKGLPFKVAFQHLFLAKLVPRFTYSFSLIPVKDLGPTQELIRTTLEGALCSTFGWSVPKRFQMHPDIWFIICRFPTVFALLRKLKLGLAARLKLGDHKAGRIFRSLYTSDKGSFEKDVHQALQEWLLLGLWDSLSKETLSDFNKKVMKISKKCWPQDLPMTGDLTWLYHNHKAFSGNVPMWAD